MCGIFGGGDSGNTPAYVPPTQASYQPRAVDASKATEDAANKQKQIIAASTNTANNTKTSSMGLADDSKVKNPALLGG